LKVLALLLSGWIYEVLDGVTSWVISKNAGILTNRLGGQLEKRGLSKLPIYNLDIYSADNLDQLLRGFETKSFQSLRPARINIVPENLIGDEDTATFLGLAGAAISGKLYGGHGCAVRDITNPKRGGLNGCIFKKAQSWGVRTKDALIAAVYRQRGRIVAHYGGVFAIQ